MHMFVCLACVSEYRYPQRCWIPLDLELQVVVSWLSWELETDCGSLQEQ